jgi:hypothetical protein
MAASINILLLLVLRAAVLVKGGIIVSLRQAGVVEEKLYLFLKEKEIGEAISYRELSNAGGVANVNFSHRNSLNRANERLKEHGKALGPSTPFGRVMVPVSLCEVRMPWPGECAECTMQGLPKRYSCPHSKSG